MADLTFENIEIKNLIENPTTENKVAVIETITLEYADDRFEDESQRRLVEDLFRDLIKGAEIEVRKALSENIISSSAIPKDVVLSLAEDVNEISSPILEFSEVLNDEDILNILKSSQDIDKQLAISNRASLSEDISDALIETHNPAVTESLLANEGAEIGQTSYEKVIEEFSDSESVIDSLIKRGDLSQDVISKVTEHVSKSIQQSLERKHGTSFSEIPNLFENTGELAAMKLMSELKVDPKLIEIVNQLGKEGSLDVALEPPENQSLTRPLDKLLAQGPLTVLSTLAMGDLELFVLGVARMAKVKPSHAMTLLRDENGFNSIYKQADLSPKMQEVTKFSLEIAYQMNDEHDQGYRKKAKDDPAGYMKMLQHHAQGKHIKQLSHFISIVRHHIARHLETVVDENQSQGW